jgi:hypothetical protein
MSRFKSNQIKPDQIKSKRHSLGSKYNRPGAHAGHILNIDPDKSPNLSVVIKECLGSNQTRSNQSVAPSVRNTTDSEHAPVISSNLSVVIKECLGLNQTRSNQLKSSQLCCVPRFKIQPTRNTTTVHTHQNFSKSLGGDPGSIQLIKLTVSFLGLKYKLLGAQPPVITLDYDMDKIHICLSHWGVTRVYSVQVKIISL